MFIGNIWGWVIFLGFILIITTFSGESESSNPLLASGRVAVGLMLIIGGSVALIRSEHLSPEIRAKISEAHKAVESMDFKELGSFVGNELCCRFGINSEQISLSLVKDLDTPYGEIDTVLDDLQIDYGLPISSNDNDGVQSVEDIIRLILARRFK